MLVEKNRYTILLHFFALSLSLQLITSLSVKSTSHRDVTEAYLRKLIAAGEKSKLSELNIFLTQMPKGGDVHNHYSGSIYAEKYLNWISKHDLCVYKDDDAAAKI